MLAQDLDTLFSLPLSPEALDEWMQLQVVLSTVAYDPNSTNTWTLI
jgi:hypothetical protein